MRANLELYNVFCSVIKNGSFLKASEELFVSQSAVTQSIKKLESQLGGRLFNRTKNGVTLTEEGKKIYLYIGDSIIKINNAENIFTQYIKLEEGKIRIGGGSALVKSLLLEPIKEFVKLYPNINIEIINGLTDDLINKLGNGELDLVVLNLPYKTSKRNIEIISCKNDVNCFVVSKDFLKGIKKQINSFEDLSNYPLILPKLPANTRKILDDFCIKNKIELNPIYEFSSPNVILTFIRNNLGVGYINKDFAKEFLDTGELVELKLEHKIPVKEIGFATANKEIASFATLKLSQLIKELQSGREEI